MKTVMKWIAGLMVGLIALVIVLGVALFIGTRGTYPVARLVTDDPALPSATIAGLKLHMRIVEGPENARTIIVLHGGPGGDFRSLQALEALSDRYRIVFYDQRGAGLSQRVPADQLTLDGYLEELGAVIDHTSPGQAPILLGHSWGAMLATAYLGQNPHAVHGAVLIEPGYLDAAGRAAWEKVAATYMTGPRYARQAITTGFRAQHVQGPDAWAADDFLIGQMVGSFASHPKNPYHCGGGYGAPGWRFGALASNTWRNTPDDEVDRLRSNLDQFQGPVLLISGACDSWLGPLQRQHQSLFARAQWVSIPKAGHDVIWDTPGETLTAIRGFLE